jgi:very-short-patch-repair endonuclease
MAVRGAYVPYRRRLTARSRALRRLVVEVDGDSHFTAGGEKQDRVRDASLKCNGLMILRFTNEDVMQRFEAVCLEIAAVVQHQKT